MSDFSTRERALDLLGNRVFDQDPIGRELADEPELIAALADLLHTAEADKLLRLLWARLRGRFPAPLRWLVDRVLGPAASSSSAPA